MPTDIDLAEMCETLQRQIEALRRERDELRGRQDFEIGPELAKALIVMAGVLSFAVSIYCLVRWG